MNDKLIRIAQVIGPAVNGGTESLWMNYYRNIDKTKFQFDFLVESTSKIINEKEIKSLGGNVVIIPSYKNIIKYIQSLEQIFRKNKYDIVHSNMNTISVFTLFAAKRAGIKIRIAHSHSTSNKKEFGKNILKIILRLFSKKYATHYVACSKLAGKYLFGKNALNSGKIKIINNAINTEMFSFNETYRSIIRNKLDINDKYVLGTIGRMQKQKNQIFLLKILKELKKIDKDKYKLIIIGDGPLKRNLEYKIEKYKIKRSVLLLGIKDHVELYYSAFDCFLLPSLYEGLPVAGIEAQVNGLNCIFSNKITSEVIISNNSFMAEINCVDDWVKKIVEFSNKKTNERRVFDEIEIDTKIYDIKSETKVLEEYYLSIYNNRIN